MNVLVDTSHEDATDILAALQFYADEMDSDSPIESLITRYETIVDRTQ